MDDASRCCLGGEDKAIPISGEHPISKLSPRPGRAPCNQLYQGGCLFQPPWLYQELKVLGYIITPPSIPGANCNYLISLFLLKTTPPPAALVPRLSATSC